MIDPVLVRDAVADVRARIARAGGVDVALVAVTKSFGVDAVLAAVAAGCDKIGENYAQECVAKLAALPGDVRPEVHFIGHLQSNKVRMLVGVVDVWETIDRQSVVDALARRAPGARVLVQVNTTGEVAKSGAEPREVANVVAAARTAGLHVEGLMTVGPTDAPAEAARPAFRLLRHLADDQGLVTCSMGMTHDLEVAVEEGSTEVRIGTALFGRRPQDGATFG